MSDADIIGLPVIEMGSQVVNLVHPGGATLCCHLTITTPGGEFDFILSSGGVGIAKGVFEEYQTNLRRVLAGELEAPAIGIGE